MAIQHDAGRPDIGKCQLDDACILGLPDETFANPVVDVIAKN
jgi:hypothetical protein